MWVERGWPRGRKVLDPGKGPAWRREATMDMNMTRMKG